MDAYEYASRSYVVDTYEYASRVVSSGTPPIYHILEKCTATFSSYLSLKRNPVFGASTQRISRPSYAAVVALTATCELAWWHAWLRNYRIRGKRIFVSYDSRKRIFVS